MAIRWHGFARRSPRCGHAAKNSIYGHCRTAKRTTPSFAIRKERPKQNQLALPTSKLPQRDTITISNGSAGRSSKGKCRLRNIRSRIEVYAPASSGRPIRSRRESMNLRRQASICFSYNAVRNSKRWNASLPKSYTVEKVLVLTAGCCARCRLLLRCGVLTIIPDCIPGVFWPREIATVGEVMDCANVLGKEKVQGPVECHPNFFVQAWQFAEVNRPPHPPGEEA